MNMRSIKILFVAVLLNVFLAGFCLGLQGSGGGGFGFEGVGTDSVTNPMVGSLSGSLTEPVSSYNPTFFTVQQPATASGNMIVTGNVGGGKHFRGYLPYGSGSDIRANLESTSMDSFLRYSAGSYQPFYSPSGSPLSVTGSGLVGVARAMSEKVRGYGAAGEFFTPFSQLSVTHPVTSRPALEYGMVAVPRYGYEQSLLGQVRGYGASAQFLQVTGEQGSEQSVVGWQDGEISLLKSNLQSTIDQDRLKPFEIEKSGEQLEDKERIDIYEQMKEHLGVGGLEDVFGKQVSRVEANEQIRKAVDEQWKSRAETADIGLFKVLESRRERQKKLLSRGGGAVVSSSTEQPQTADKKYKTFAGENEDEFNNYVKSAERYLKEGKFYQAEDAYMLATLYKSLDPLPYVGRSHALFAAGEYLSSSRMLAFALRIFPDYARVKVDLVQMLGDKRIIEMRLAELGRWSSVSDSGELQLLLAYISYQMDKAVLAKAAIDEAYKNRPNDPAVLALKKVIDELRSVE